MRALFLYLALFFGCLSATAQASKPFKNADTIIIKTGLSPKEAYFKWGNYLLQGGYSFAESNNSVLTLITKPRNTRTMNYDYILAATVAKNGDIILRAKYRIKYSIMAFSSSSKFRSWRFTGRDKVTTQDILQTVRGFGSYPINYLNSQS